MILRDERIGGGWHGQVDRGASVGWKCVFRGVGA
jgi:hypothetical protein